MDNNNRTEEYRYLLSIFTFVLNTTRPYVNTIFRLIYIYIVSVNYLHGNNSTINEVILSNNIGVGDLNYLERALAAAMAEDYVQLTDENRLVAGEKLNDWLDALLKSSIKAKKDYQRIAYFADVLISYGEEVVLSLFYNEPNVTEATARNKDYINLQDNKLFGLLQKFEEIVNKRSKGSIEKYDVFIRWLDYVLDQYLKEKLTDE